MAFKNRIRLPFYLSKPQFPMERSVFRKADGTSKTLSVVVRNTVQGLTDYLPEDWHRKLAIALAHDNVDIEGDRYNTGVVLNGDYQIDWQEFLNYPVAQSGFELEITPFNATNSNCMTCSAATQLNLQDDTFPGVYGDGEAGSANVFENDEICCYPPLAEIVYINNTFLASASIGDEGSFEFESNPVVSTQSNVKIATYRVTCEDGSFDEADIYASFNGSGGESCCQPYGISFDNVINVIYWQADCNPDNGFVWDFRTAANPGVVISSGSSLPAQRNINLPGPVAANPGDYIFTIYSDCGGSQSTTTIFNFNIPAPASECYGFDANYSAVSGPASATFSYMNCAGDIVNVVVGRFSVVRVCAAVSTGITPVYWTSNQPDSYFTPMAPCGSTPAIEGNYDVSSTELSVCSSPIGIIAYSSAPFGPGITLYSDPGLTTPISAGYSFIKDGGGNIYTLSSGTIGLPTGNSC